LITQRARNLLMNLSGSRERANDGARTHPARTTEDPDNANPARQPALQHARREKRTYRAAQAAVT